MAKTPAESSAEPEAMEMAMDRPDADVEMAGEPAGREVEMEVAAVEADAALSYLAPIRSQSQSPSPLLQLPALVLAAVDSLLAQQSLLPSSTAYFATLSLLLEQALENGEDVAHILTLYSLVIPHVSPAVLMAKFKHVKMLLSILLTRISDSTEQPEIRHTISIIFSFLSKVQCGALFRDVAKYTLDPRPKVRKVAGDGVVTALRGEHGKVFLKFISCVLSASNMEMREKGAKRDSEKMENLKKDGEKMESYSRDSKLIHLIALLNRTFTHLKPHHTKLITLLLKIPFRSIHILESLYSLFKTLLALDPDVALVHVLLDHLLVSKPYQNNEVLFPLYLEIVADSFILISLKTEKSSSTPQNISTSKTQQSDPLSNSLLKFIAGLLEMYTSPNLKTKILEKITVTINAALGACNAMEIKMEVGGKVKEMLADVKMRDMWGYLLDVVKGLVDVSAFMSSAGIELVGCTVDCELVGCDVPLYLPWGWIMYFHTG